LEIKTSPAIADLMEGGLRMGVHCHPCGRHVVIDPATLPLSPELPVPSLERRFRCTRCGSKQTEARPEWPGR
jgi:DNA-directed RNA polymerase subunit RPC12/RpoP